MVVLPDEEPELPDPPQPSSAIAESTAAVSVRFIQLILENFITMSLPLLRENEQR